MIQAFFELLRRNEIRSEIRAKWRLITSSREISTAAHHFVDPSRDLQKLQEQNIERKCLPQGFTMLDDRVTVTITPLLLPCVLAATRYLRLSST